MNKEFFNLKVARVLYHQKKYAQIINTLEKKIFDYYDDVDFFHVLSSSYYQTGDLNGAHAFATRIINLAPQHLDANILLAAIYTKRGDYTKAVKHCLNVLDQNPEEPRAKLLLEQLRKNQTKDELKSWVQSRHFQKIRPRIPGKPLPIKLIFGLVFFSFLLFSLTFLISNWLAQRLQPRNPESIRPGIEERGISGLRELLKFDGAFDEILLASEIEQLFRQAQDLMLDYRDNEARVVLNRIINSNASEQVKSQALSLIELQSRPDFTSEFKSFSTSEIKSRPKIYNGVYVRWQGSVANLQVNETEIVFDFLVGYHEGRVLEAVVPSKIRFAVRINNGDPIDVLGRIVVQDNSWFLDVMSIHVMGVRKIP